VDSSESLLSSSGLGSVSIFGLSSLSLDYALKKKTSLLVIFISKHIKKKNCCSSLTAFSFYYACLFGVSSLGCFYKIKES
jgi:hypothetical protein